MGDDDKKSPKGSFISGTLIAMIVVAVILLFIAFRGLFMPGGNMETNNTIANTQSQIAAPKTDTTTSTTTDTSKTTAKEITYTVKSGDTLAAIGLQYNVDWHEIATLNKLEAPYDNIKVGQKLTIPATAETTTSDTTKDTTTTTTDETAADTTTDKTSTSTVADSGKTYTVKAGDGMAAIGAELGVDWKQMAELNDLAFPYSLTVGQKLKIPAAATTTTGQ